MNNELDVEQFRQGDVLIVRKQSKAKGDVITPEPNRVVLMHGELTGHAHAFYEDGAIVFSGSPGKVRNLSLVKPLALLHEEHSSPIIPIGDFDLPIQTEWTDEKEPRQVAD